MIKRTVIYHVLYILQNVNKNKDITFQKPVNNWYHFQMYMIFHFIIITYFNKTSIYSGI